MSKKESHPKPRKLTAGRVISWVVGIYMILNGFVLLFSQLFLGIVLMIGGVLIAPFTNNYLEKKHNTTISGGLKVLIFFVVIIIIFVSAFNTAFNNDDVSSLSGLTEASKSIKYIEIHASTKNWDADAEADGIEVTIYPKDSSDTLVRTSGKINATLYKIVYDPNYNTKKGSWILNWVKYMSTTDCGWISCEIRLDREDLAEVNQNYGLNDIAILEVTLTTDDGKSFTAIDDYAYLKP